MVRLIAAACVIGLLAPRPTSAQSTWRSEVLPVKLQVGYAVRAVDISGDGKLDIAIVDSKRFIWLENPTWKVHVMHEDNSAAHDNVCFAPHDIDGDGDIDFAVGRDWQFGNSDSGGHIGWLRCPDNPRDKWTYTEITQEPTTHRMNWIDWDNDGTQELFVVPLKGRGSRPPGFDDVPIRILMLSPPSDLASEASGHTWDINVFDDSLHVSHNLDVVDLDGDERDDLLTASYEGVTWFRNRQGDTAATRLGTGLEGQPPARGASEVRLGRLADNKPFIATIEPWHGDQVVVYTEPTPSSNVAVGTPALWTRHVLDRELKWGHAVACANVDENPGQELIVGVRDDVSAQHRSGVRIYKPINPEQGTWARTLVEPGQVAVEDLVVADLDGDSDNDIVAVGRATHNAVIYWNQR